MPQKLSEPERRAKVRRKRTQVERYMLRLDDDRYERLRLQAFAEHRPQIDVIRSALDLYMQTVDRAAMRAAKA